MPSGTCSTSCRPTTIPGRPSDHPGDGRHHQDPARQGLRLPEGRLDLFRHRQVPRLRPPVQDQPRGPAAGQPRRRRRVRKGERPRLRPLEGAQGGRARLGDRDRAGPAGLAHRMLGHELRSILGRTFDIHCGGVDNIFPHHENEIAQSEAANGVKFVNYLAPLPPSHRRRREDVQVQGQFLSGSRTSWPRDTIPEEVRFLLLSTHYRKMLNFTDEALAQARTSRNRIRNLPLRASRHVERDLPPESRPWPRRSRRPGPAFVAGLEDDLNISEALAALFELVRSVNTVVSRGELGREDAGPASSRLVTEHRRQRPGLSDRRRRAPGRHRGCPTLLGSTVEVQVAADRGPPKGPGREELQAGRRDPPGAPRGRHRPRGHQGRRPLEESRAGQALIARRAEAGRDGRQENDPGAGPRRRRPRLRISRAQEIHDRRPRLSPVPRRDRHHRPGRRRPRLRRGQDAGRRILRPAGGVGDAGKAEGRSAGSPGAISSPIRAATSTAGSTSSPSSSAARTIIASSTSSTRSKGSSPDSGNPSRAGAGYCL